VQGVSLTGWIAGNLLSSDPNPVPLDPLPTETPAAAASPDTGTPLPAGEPALIEEPVAEADLGDAPVEKGETSGEQDGDRDVDEERQETWPIFAAGTTTSVSAGPLNLHVEPVLSATVLTALPAGYMATVMAGPVEGEGIAWYQVVTAEGVAGWCDGSFLQSQ
jgi:hypothetical protein